MFRRKLVPSVLIISMLPAVVVLSMAVRPAAFAAALPEKAVFNALSCACSVAPPVSTPRSMVVPPLSEI